MASGKKSELRTEFKDVNEKANFVNKVMTISSKAMTDGDNLYNMLNYALAKAEYVVALDGFMHLMKLTADDANFQTYLKQKINYLLERAEKTNNYIQMEKMMTPNPAYPNPFMSQSTIPNIPSVNPLQRQGSTMIMRAKTQTAI